ncbi:indole-3-glycerol phosphate synthase TrpC [Gammaproteobacteria bacterium]|nr:indole-3-glycerol phosphate synthase TrpC [Gammaproteobacteria bacterium]MDC0406407.1 indole-3-glycerol phosphate synthase TrpC [Gammaproteobacteria bacterium]MDC0420936.1 indole-3-glycerol phosphate synthase TrpC [Gammaproteobacteria bacterium]
MTILNDIVENTRAKLESKKAELPLAEIISKLNELNLPKGAFKESLLNKDEAIIAEIKKASPSAGIISEDFDPIKKAKEYEDFGASALSILTEEDFFQGSSQYLQDVKAITSLPILRKDFMIDEYQIYEAKLIGADCILLIASVLNDDEIQSFVDLAESLELDYLIEIHDLNELERVKNFSNAMIGVNNRNLKTFDVDLNNSINLKNAFNSNNLFVAESGIKSQDDIDTLKAHDIHVFLIGESLMKGDFA